MGTLRIERSRLHDWATRPVGAAWRSFDLQLTIYALLLASIGLAMAYSNSGDDTLLQGGSTFLRGLMWAGIAIVVFTVAAVFFIILTIPLARFTDHLVKERELRERAQAV